LGKPGGALEHALSESVGAQGRGVLSISYPISQRQPATEGNDDGRTRLLGYVYTGMSANEWQRSLAAHMDFVIGVGAIALIVVVPLGFWLVHRIMAPVDSLAETMIKFSHGGLNVRSKVKGGDEIGRLAQAFNRMADQHRQTHERLVRLNLELERRVAERTWQLRELASREPLTGLYNRRHFNEVLRRRFAEAIRHGSELSCIMIDLDGFKHANDAFGHQVGDELLVLTATMILSQLRVSDVAARYGGDEFILLLPQTDAEQAHVLGQRIMQQFDREALTRFPQAKVSMSMGVSSVNSSGVSEADELVKSADQAMYAAKQAGKGRVVMASRAAQGAGV